MSFLVILNMFFTICTYAVVLFFLIAIVRTFAKSKNIQDTLVYAIMMVPFVLRLLRLK